MNHLLAALDGVLWKWGGGGAGAVSFAAMHQSEAGAAVTSGDDFFSPVSCLRPKLRLIATQLAQVWPLSSNSWSLLFVCQELRPASSVHSSTQGFLISHGMDQWSPTTTEPSPPFPIKMHRASIIRRPGTQ